MCIYDARNRLVKATKAYRESGDTVQCGIAPKDTCGLRPDHSNRRRNVVMTQTTI